MTLDELRKNQLEILDVVMNFCDEHNINCWLNGGTLLGAVRHKGYIPWDDDIDLGMLRPDYDKFIKLFNQQNTRYKFHCFETDPDCLMSFGKVWDNTTVLYEPDERGLKLAVNIDIFVCDNAPDDDAMVNKMFRVRDFFGRCNLHRKLPIVFRYLPKKRLLRSVAAYIFKIVLRVFPRDYFTLKTIANTKRFINENTKRVGDFTGGCRAVIDRTALENTTWGEFEGKKYKIPVGWDEWLTALYGDYMQLPPVEERLPHDMIAYKI